MIYLELFLCFLQVGFFSIGGGYAAIPLIQEQVVDVNKWLTMQEFTDLVTIAEMTPGPIAINSATFVGINVAGFGGAIIATIGCITPSLVIVTLLAVIYYKYKKLSTVQDVLSALRPAVVSLIASTGITILVQVLFGTEKMLFENINFIALVMFGWAIVFIRKYKWNPILIMSLCGIVNLLIGITKG